MMFIFLRSVLININGVGLLSRACNVSACSKKQTGAQLVLLSQPICHYAESGNYCQVEEDGAHKEIAILRMNRKPFNGLNKEFMDELKNNLKSLEKNDTCRGVIITSAIPGIFSAGLDITEIYQRSQDHVAALWRSFHDVTMTLYGTSLVTIAAVNGHAIAGGCMKSLSCDYRIMAEGKYNIGFSATRFGVITPYWVHEVMSKSCGNRLADLGLQLGTLYKPNEALTIGLVDELSKQEELISVAKKQMLKWLKIPDRARIMTKEMLRMPLIKKALSQREDEIAYFTNFIQKDDVQEPIGRFLESLKRK